MYALLLFALALELNRQKINPFMCPNAGKRKKINIWNQVNDNEKLHLINIGECDYENRKVLGTCMYMTSANVPSDPEWQRTLRKKW